ncbi:MAG: pyridoxamine 5-phosphate oxidase [Tissierellia bacterium]|nr:pyridoxamine 5-phosphate oxidase [Tissierellia bacterium]
MKVVDFLKNAKVFYVSTCDGDQPRVRPIGFVMEYNGQLAFNTDTRKNMFKQLKANPKIEISAIDENLNSLRITGRANFITSEDSQKAALEAMPMLAKIGYTVGDGIFEIYTLDDVAISYTSMTGKQLDGIEL